MFLASRTSARHRTGTRSDPPSMSHGKVRRYPVGTSPRSPSSNACWQCPSDTRSARGKKRSWENANTSAPSPSHLPSPSPANAKAPSPSQYHKPSHHISYPYCLFYHEPSPTNTRPPPSTPSTLTYAIPPATCTRTVNVPAGLQVAKPTGHYPIKEN